MKKILLSGIVGVFILSGCLSTNPNKVKPSSTQVKVNESKAQDTAVEVKKERFDALPKSSLRDKVIEEEVEISDDDKLQTHDTKPQIIESVQ